MNKAMFLSELRHNLRRLPESEINNAIVYYEEYFNDAGEQNEQRVLDELESPATIAANIIGEFAVSEEGKKKPSHTMWIVLLAILASPIAFPIAITFFALIFAAVIVIGSLFFAISVVGISVVVAGFAAIITGIGTLVTSFGVALFYLGSGLVLIPLGVICTVITFKIFKVIFRGLAGLVGGFLARRSSR